MNNICCFVNFIDVMNGVELSSMGIEISAMYCCHLSEASVKQTRFMPRLMR